eukprot:scpid92536/ scgid34835/ 
MDSCRNSVKLKRHNAAMRLRGSLIAQCFLAVPIATLFVLGVYVSHWLRVAGIVLSVPCPPLILGFLIQYVFYAMRLRYLKDASRERAGVSDEDMVPAGTGDFQTAAAVHSTAHSVNSRLGAVTEGDNSRSSEEGHGSLAAASSPARHTPLRATSGGGGSGPEVRLEKSACLQGSSGYIVYQNDCVTDV